MSLVNEYFADTNTFAVFSQLAKLLTAEDIIVRWNVRGMESPAAMNMAGRILDVAPIKAGFEDQIPGLIFHEVGHFLFSDVLSKKLEHSDVVIVDEEKFKEFRAAVKSHHIWNIIEDGYIERKVVAKWPGALKHLLVVHQHQQTQYRRHPAFAIDVINTLHMNVMGMKWGERYQYNSLCTPELLALVERARTITGSALDRALLSSAIFDEINNIIIPLPKIKVKKKQQGSVAEINDQKILDEVDILKQQRRVSSSAAVSSTDNDDIQDDDSILTDTDLVKSEKTVTPDNNISELPSSSISEVEAPGAPEVSAEVEHEEREQLDLVEFISDNAATILGSNRYYMRTIVNCANDGQERFIPSLNEVMLTSSLRDIIPENVSTLLKGKSFNRFVNEQLKHPDHGGLNRDAKKLFAVYQEKIEKSKAIAQSMFQQFNAKANALNIANSSRRTTGALDPTRASLFMIYDDIFKKKQLAPNQINHGYVVMIDWSSSMTGSIMELFHRLSELTHFAKLATVELEVWLYTTDDTKTAEHHLDVVKSKIRPHTLLTGSLFVKVLSTREHGQEDINYRLFTMFVQAAHEKGGAAMVNRGLQTFNWSLPNHFSRSVSFRTFTYNEMGGTNIYESIVFATHRASKLSADRKAIMLITDGEDAGAFSIVIDDELDRQSASKDASKTAKFYEDENVKTSRVNVAISRVMMGGIDLLSFSNQSRGTSLPEVNKYKSTNLFKNVRTTASFFAAEEARKNGVSVIGITWGAFKSKELVTITRNNVVRIDVPRAAIMSKNVSHYTIVNNAFISNITEALLSNIRQ